MAARFSEDGVYRYELARRWARGPVATWIMLNPSTADAVQDDPTIRRCAGFTRSWGLSGIVVVNLFALRSTDPKVLRIARDPVGPDNDDAIHDACVRARLVVAAWGTHGDLFRRNERVLELLAMTPARVTCLGHTKDGHPRHPLYLPKDACPVDVEHAA